MYPENTNESSFNYNNVDNWSNFLQEHLHDIMCSLSESFDEFRTEFENLFAGLERINTTGEYDADRRASILSHQTAIIWRLITVFLDKYITLSCSDAPLDYKRLLASMASRQIFNSLLSSKFTKSSEEHDYLDQGAEISTQTFTDRAFWVEEIDGRFVIKKGMSALPGVSECFIEAEQRLLQQLKEKGESTDDAFATSNDLMDIENDEGAREARLIEDTLKRYFETPLYQFEFVANEFFRGLFNDLRDLKNNKNEEITGSNKEQLLEHQRQHVHIPMVWFDMFISSAFGKSSLQGLNDEQFGKFQERLIQAGTRMIQDEILKANFESPSITLWLAENGQVLQGEEAVQVMRIYFAAEEAVLLKKLSDANGAEESASDDDEIRERVVKLREEQKTLVSHFRGLMLKTCYETTSPDSLGTDFKSTFRLF